MARNDGVDRTCARNMDVTDNDIGDAQAHNEREKEIYSNEDIIPERSSLNVHFKEPTGSYAEMFEQMKADNIISTRGLKADAVHFNEMVFDVNSAYFDNHGGYEYARQFYEEAYKSAVEIVGGNSISSRQSCTLTRLTGRCPKHLARTCSIIIFMWSMSLWWRNRFCGRNAARMKLSEER